ncbi:PH domain-containing protein [Rhodopirellula halodulae]|uniref:PH domain-containing protein n=1 Tax=Rhodopirellula halodulae TaxID=2894198 RepID=UPI001E456CD1|nr:PH domain-containing protein [Rhodopirellula sp. JC737]MCC9658465.1 PH domain-containing protein [Rhodopirellula sp. JC737]
MTFDPQTTDTSDQPIEHSAAELKPEVGPVANTTASAHAEDVNTAELGVDLDSREFQSLPIEALKLDHMIGTVLVVGLLLASVIGWGLATWMRMLNFDLTIWAGAANLVLLGLAIYFGWFYPSAAYEAAAWRISNEGLEIRSGVWWRHRISVPHSRMQHSDIAQGPLQRMHGLSTLVVHTAGTKNSSVQLENLNSEMAERLRDALINGRLETQSEQSVIAPPVEQAVEPTDQTPSSMPPSEIPLSADPASDAPATDAS